MKEETNAVLEIKSVQNGEESTLFISDARVIDRKKYRLIEFDGTEICGVPGEVTSFKLFGNNDVEMMTNGKRVSSSMSFVRGVTQHCHYDDMFGEPVTVCFSTSNITSSSNDSGGNVEIDYSVELNNMLASRNSMKLTYRFSDRK